MRKRKSMMSEYWILCPLRTVAVVLTRKGLCESVSDHPLWTRHHLSLSPLPRPTPPTPTSPIAFVGTHQSVPSHSRPTRRPSRSMRPGWGFKGTRDPFGKGSSQSSSGSRGQGHHQHPHQRSQPGPHRPARRQKIEVIANGLPLCGGAQLAVDATLVFPLTSSSQSRRRAGQYARAALQDARKSKERACPEFLRSRRCRLLVLSKHPPQS